MPKREMRNGELYIYCEEDDKWFPKFKMNCGIRMELDEKYFIYVLEGDTIDESLERNRELDEEEDYILSVYYGEARRKYLQENKPVEYADMEFFGTLEPHLYELDKQAQKMEDRLVEQYKKLEGVTEELKKANQLEWVGQMNSILHRVREIVQHELIFV